MIPKRFITLCILSAMLVLARISSAADDNYSRSMLWNTGATNDIQGSDTEVNVPGSLWSYEVVPAVTNPDNRLAGSAPWYQLPASGAVTWDPLYLRWQGPANGLPRFEGNFLHARLQAGQYGQQPRVAWKAPSAGTVHLAGSFGFEAGGGVTRTIEWAIAKRNGTTYTLLASGSMNPSTQAETAYTLADIGGLNETFTSAGRTCYMRYPKPGGVPVTNRRLPLVMVGHGQTENGSHSSNVYEQHVLKGYFVVAPTFGQTSNTTNATDLQNVITDLLGRNDLPVQIDRDRIGYSGVSFGGMTGLTLYRTGYHDLRIKAIAPRVAYAPGSGYDWPVATPLFMVNGEADTVININLAEEDYNSAYPPKAFVKLAGVGHNQAGAWPILSNGNYGFFGFFLKGEPNGLNAVATAAAGMTNATMFSDWASAVPNDPISGNITQVPVSNYPALADIPMQAGEELIWTFRATDLTSPYLNYTMNDQPLTLTFTPSPNSAKNTWQQY